MPSNIGEKLDMLNKGNPFHIKKKDAPVFNRGRLDWKRKINTAGQKLSTWEAKDDEGASSSVIVVIIRASASKECAQPSALGKALLVLKTHPPLFIHLAKFRIFIEQMSEIKQK